MLETSALIDVSRESIEFSIDFSFVAKEYDFVFKLFKTSYRL